MVEKALSATLDEPIRVTPAGRTDAGVHASGQVLSFKTAGRLAPDVIVRAANARLPDDILVHWAAEMPVNFDARRRAIRRHYRYTIWNGLRPNLWYRRLAWHLPSSLDVTAMRDAANELVGCHDFASFAGADSRQPATRTSVRTVERASWRVQGALLHFEITADAFLRHMVRGIVGTLVLVGQHKLGTNELNDILASADRRNAGPNAPPTGLMLVGVNYPDEMGGTSCRTMDEAPWSES